jgi:hypothetical protein
VRRVEISDVSAYEAGQGVAAATDSSGEITETSYTSDDSSISISRVVTGSGDATVSYP